MTSHQEQAEQLAFEAPCENFCYEDDGAPCANCLAYIEKIRAALDAAAREALNEAADELGQRIGFAAQEWIRSRADSLSGRHEEETKTKS